MWTVPQAPPSVPIVVSEPRFDKGYDRGSQSVCAESSNDGTSSVGPFAEKAAMAIQASNLISKRIHKSIYHWLNCTLYCLTLALLVLWGVILMNFCFYIKRVGVLDGIESRLPGWCFLWCLYTPKTHLEGVFVVCWVTTYHTFYFLGIIFRLNWMIDLLCLFLSLS